MSTVKIDCPMSCKTKPCQSSREALGMLHAVPPQSPRPPKFNLKYGKTVLSEKENCALLL